MNNFFELLVKNKDLATIIITAIIGIGTIVVGIATIIVMNRQTTIVARQTSLQYAAQQPIFRISTEYQDWDDKKNDTQIITIFNDGNPVKHITNIKVETFFGVDATKDRVQKNIILPITAYYFASSTSSNLTGQIFTAFFINNNYRFHELYREAMKHTKGENYYFLSKFDLIKIEYIDVNSLSNTVLYKNREPINREIYDSIIDATSKYKYDVFDIEKITFDDILKCVNEEYK